MSHACDGRDLACGACAAIARRAGAVRSAMTVDDQLDDIARARIWTALEDRLGEPVARTRARWPAAIAVAAAAAVVAIAVVAREPRRTAPHVLAVPVDTTVSSQLGPHTRASIVGPAQLELGESGPATSVRLRSGTLLAEFTGGAGRSLRIDAPGAVIEIVGTLFSVEVHGDRTCTSVAHGRVRVTTPTAVVMVGGGQQFCTGDALQPIPHDVRDALEHHGALITADARLGSPGAPRTLDTSPPNLPSAPPVTSPPVPPTPVAPSAAPGDSTVASSTVANPSSMHSSGTSSAPSTGSPTSTSRVAAASPSTGASTGSPTTSSRGSSPTTSSRTPATVPTTTAPPKIATPTTSARAPAPAVTSLPTTPPATSPPRTTTSTAASTVEQPAKRPPTADELYRTAEAALAARQLVDADRALSALLADYPDSPVADQALYDRARIAFQQKAWAAARRHLDKLAAVRGSALAEPGHWLRCRVALEARDASAAACLVEYRRTFPRAPHDLDALGVAAQLAHTAGGCSAARPLIDELAQTYPRTTLAAAWRTRCPEAR